MKFYINGVNSEINFVICHDVQIVPDSTVPKAQHVLSLLRKQSGLNFNQSYSWRRA